MRSIAPSHLTRRAIIYAALAVILTWLVISRSLAAYLADAAPNMALWLNPSQPEALVNLADSALNGSVEVNGPSTAVADQEPKYQGNAPDGATNTSGNRSDDSLDFNRTFKSLDQNRTVDLSKIRTWAESALIHEPLDARALGILGQVASAGNDNMDAEKFMRAAARLSLHDSVALYWLMFKSTEAGDFRSAIYYADILLRTSPELIVHVMPVLGRIAGDKESVDMLEKILASDPPWRERFFQALPGFVADARTPLDLLLALRTSSVPPTSAEFGRYIDVLVYRKYYDLAYYTWLQFLPTRELRNAGLLFNGNFETPLSGLPFDWQIISGSGVTIDIVPRPDKNGGHALLVDFQYGRVDYHSVTQLTVLTPGTYEFKGEYKGQLIGPRGLKWRVVCAGQTDGKIGESSTVIGKVQNWTNISFSFTIPATDCRAQYVRLDLDARMASEQLVSGSMLFDELQISRVANSPT